MVYGYIRVLSNHGNSIETQELKHAGCEHIYTDGLTGSKQKYPEFEKLRAMIRKGDTLVVSKLDRLGRTVSQAAELITEFLDEGITINILDTGVLNSSTVNTLLKNVLHSFSKFERDIFVQRTQEGKAVAKANNPDFREGRPPKYTKAQFNRAMKLLEDHSYSEVVKMTGISRSTLMREKQKRQNADREVIA